MRVMTAIVCALVGGLGLVLEAMGQDQRRMEFPRVAQDLKIYRNVVLAGRFAIEMRRVGGPRASVVMGLLENEPLPDGGTWTREALVVCNDRGVRCSDVLSVLDRLQAMGHRTEPKFEPNERAAVEEAAKREALSPEMAAQLHHLAIARGGAREGAVFELAEEAAFRIYDERIRELYSAADAFLDGNGNVDRSRPIAARRVARASEDRQPLSALLGIVREVAVWDANAWSLPDDQRRAAQFSELTSKARLLDYALQELRRRNLPGTLPGLTEIMNVFESKRMLAANPAMSWVFANRRQTPRWFLDLFSSDIAEAIGDFGNRDLEREVLGGRCLWDMVNEGEMAMVAKKMLAPDQMLTNAMQ